MPADAFEFDVLILGGGVAGLWTACHLADRGYTCALIEKHALGADQTIASQGIIHGGIKYALTGEASRASRAIARMPELWRACLAGGQAPAATDKIDSADALIDLRAARVLSEHQLLWTTPGLISRIAAAAASKAIRTPVERLDRDQAAELFADAPRGVDLYRVAEPVLDPRSIVIALADQARKRGIPLLAPAHADPRISVRRPANQTLSHGDAHAPPDFECHYAESDHAHAHHPPHAHPRIFASAVVLAAGSANQRLAALAGLIAHDERIMQLRPLHMVMAKRAPGPTYGHCLGSSTTPRITITSIDDPDAGTVWNIGGAIAESGVDRDEHAQLAAAREELRACLPWLDTSACELTTARWDRAEGLTPDGSRPDEPVVRPLGDHSRVFAVWPTKLAFAPELAVRIAAAFTDANVRPSARSRDSSPTQHELCASGALRPAAVAPHPWNRPQQPGGHEGGAWN